MKSFQICIPLYLLLYLTIFAHSAVAKITEQSIDLSAAFNGINGTAVFYSPQENLLQIYNKDMARIQAPPQSTFKIISTLMGLENGIIKDKNSKMRYNGTKYWLDAWNKDVNLAEAFQFSCVWYYHQLVYAIEQAKVAEFLKKLHYGNEDLSQWMGNGSDKKTELNGFWLSSSLKISPLEQVQVLANIFEGKSFIQSDNIKIVQEIMQQKPQEQAHIYAKTGSNVRGKSWFVGYLELAKGKKYFAFYVDDAKGGVSGAKDIALKVLLDKANKDLQ